MLNSRDGGMQVKVCNPARAADSVASACVPLYLAYASGETEVARNRMRLYNSYICRANLSVYKRMAPVFGQPLDS